MACFADINVSQSSVATYARCVGTFNVRLIANLPRNLLMNKFSKSVKICQNMIMGLWPALLAHPVCLDAHPRKFINRLDDKSCYPVLVRRAEIIPPCFDIMISQGLDMLHMSTF